MRSDGNQPDGNRIYYLTVPRAVRDIGSWCVTAGRSRTRPGQRYPPDELRHPYRYRAVSDHGRVLDELQIVLIADGSGSFEGCRGEQRSVGAGACLVLMPGTWHRYHPDPDTGWREYWVGVRGDSVERAVRLLGLEGRGPVISSPHPEELAETYERLLDLASVHDSAAHVEIIAEVLRLVVRIARTEDPMLHGRFDGVDRAIRVMQAAVTAGVDLPRLAAQCGFSETTFRRRFRARVGTSPYRYFMALKVNAVKHELAGSELPLKAIAERFGFTDQFHLSRVFREYTGVSPGRWRRFGG